MVLILLDVYCKAESTFMLENNFRKSFAGDVIFLFKIPKRVFLKNVAADRIGIKSLIVFVKSIHFIFGSSKLGPLQC